jgi:hypothetical protein
MVLVWQKNGLGVSEPANWQKGRAKLCLALPMGRVTDPLAFLKRRYLDGDGIN